MLELVGVALILLLLLAVVAIAIRIGAVQLGPGGAKSVQPEQKGRGTSLALLLLVLVPIALFLRLLPEGIRKSFFWGLLLLPLIAAAGWLTWWLLRVRPRLNVLRRAQSGDCTGAISEIQDEIERKGESAFRLDTLAMLYAT